MNNGVDKINRYYFVLIISVILLGRSFFSEAVSGGQTTRRTQEPIWIEGTPYSVEAAVPMVKTLLKSNEELARMKGLHAANQLGHQLRTRRDIVREVQRLAGTDDKKISSYAGYVLAIIGSPDSRSFFEEAAKSNDPSRKNFGAIGMVNLPSQSESDYRLAIRAFLELLPVDVETLESNWKRVVAAEDELNLLAHQAGLKMPQKPVIFSKRDAEPSKQEKFVIWKRERDQITKWWNENEQEVVDKLAAKVQ